MAVIGTFTSSKDGGWVGSIRTLTIAAKVRLVPNDDRTSKKAPAFRVFVGSSRIGEAWEARTGGLSPKEYLRVRLECWRSRSMRLYSHRRRVMRHRCFGAGVGDLPSCSYQ